MLLPAATRLEVVPNGVDTSVFQPGSKAAARNRLGWPQEAFIVMFAGVSGRSNPYKDFATMREAVRLAANMEVGRSMQFSVVGDAAPPEEFGGARIEFLPHRDSMSECYQAADVYLHAAKMDTFPTAVLEALACGVPVVAAAVGGISEQIVDGETGFLAPAGDAPSLARHLALLARSPELMLDMGAAAGRDAADRFSLNRMAAQYEQLYRETIEEKIGTRGR
jgi:glycosyltransferase involved in cell wall biosynthesis